MGQRLRSKQNLGTSETEERRKARVIDIVTEVPLESQKGFRKIDGSLGWQVMSLNN